MDYTLIAEVQNYIRRYKKTTQKLSIPVRKHLPQFLVETTNDISSVTGTWNPVEILTPDGSNCQKEKDRFFTAFLDNTTYNPQFTYTYAESFDIKTSRQKIIRTHESLTQWTPRTRLEALIKKSLENKIIDDLATCDMVEGIQEYDQRKIATAIDHKYTDLNPDLYDYSKREYLNKTQGKHLVKHEAKGILSHEEISFLKSITYNAEEIKKAFEWALNEYGLLRTETNDKGYQVIIDDKATSIDVRDKSEKGPTIFVPRSRKAKADKLLCLIAHEIEGHVRQSQNGWDLFMVGGGLMKIDDEMLYEGLAKRYDDEFRKKFFGIKESVPNPYCTFAVHKVQNGFSFYEIFTEQLDMRLHVKLRIAPDKRLPTYQSIDDKLLTKCMENAWSTTVRVMRGHTDTANPKGFTMTKDLSYLRGWQIDKQLVELGHRHINEAAILTIQDLSFLAEFDLSPDTLAYPYKDITTKYWKEILRPQMQKHQTANLLPSSIPTPTFAYYQSD